MTVCACMYAECAKLGRCLATEPHARALANPLPVYWRDLKTEPVLLGQLQDAAGRPMTAEEAFEQRVSFVFSTQDGMTKDQVREALLSLVPISPAAKEKTV